MVYYLINWPLKQRNLIFSKSSLRILMKLSENVHLTQRIENFWPPFWSQRPLMLGYAFCWGRVFSRAEQKKQRRLIHLYVSQWTTYYSLKDCNFYLHRIKFKKKNHIFVLVVLVMRYAKSFYGNIIVLFFYYLLLSVAHCVLLK